METRKIDRKAFALVSGGLDSVTALYQAMSDNDGNAEGVSIDYGQRHRKEIGFAMEACHNLGIKHTVLQLESLLAGSMLTSSRALPNADYADLPAGVSPTYVPFRNGLMLSMLTAYAQKWIDAAADDYAKDASNDPAKREVAKYFGEAPRREAVLYFGAHAEDAHNWAYPDCTPEFIGAMANAIYVGSYRAIRLAAPLMNMRKDQIVKLGNELAVPFQHTWSCYAGGELHCGTCPTCRARKAAFIHAGVEDPTHYLA